MTAKPKLTARDIEAMPCPPGKRDALFAIEGGPKGFYLRVTQAGARTYLLQYPFDGATRRLPLGQVGEVKLAEARRLAERARGQVAAGRDPWAERKQDQAARHAAREAAKAAEAASAYTLAHLVADWQETGLQDRSVKHRNLAAATLRLYLPDLWHRPAHGITTAEVQARLDALAKRGRHAAARHLLAYGRACGNWAVRRQKLPASPFHGLVLEARAQARDRVLSEAEIGAVWLAAGEVPYPFGPMVRLLLLTLQRRSEVAGMTWSELADDLSVWTLPAARAKNKRAHLVHLAPAAQALLAGLPHRAVSDLVFTTTGRTPVSGLSKPVEQIRARVAELLRATGQRAQPKPWTLHDFRRAGVTLLAQRGVPPHVADRLLNHVQGTISGVAAVYQRNEFLPEREAAMMLWADAVLAAAEKLARTVLEDMPSK